MSVIFHVSLKFHQANSARNILKDFNAYFLNFALFIRRKWENKNAHFTGEDLRALPRLSREYVAKYSSATKTFRTKVAVKNRIHFTPSGHFP
jgi:hypothetical protein